MNMTDALPVSVEQAVLFVMSALDQKDVDYILRTDTNPADIHHDFGMSMRNRWGLWTQGPLQRSAVERYGIAHADDISGLIMAWVWAAVRREPFDAAEHVRTYHDFWNKHGTDALAAGGWPDASSA